MRGGLVIGALLGVCGFAFIGLATRPPPGPADVNEPHTMSAPSPGYAAHLGGKVLVQCALPDGTSYLATTHPSGLSAIAITFRVVTVTAAELDSPPRGPFTESCAHWEQRHHVPTNSSAQPPG